MKAPTLVYLKTNQEVIQYLNDTIKELRNEFKETGRGAVKVNLQFNKELLHHVKSNERIILHLKSLLKSLNRI